jgi:hypothetical protein
MLIEYKIKFEKDGLTITQRLEPRTSAQVKSDAPVVDHILGETHEQSVAARAARPRKGSGPSDSPDIGTGPDGFGTTAPIILIGPIILSPPAASADDEAKE